MYVSLEYFSDFLRDFDTPFLEAGAFGLDFFFAAARLVGAVLAAPFFVAVVDFAAVLVARLRVVLRFLAVPAVVILAVAM